MRVVFDSLHDFCLTEAWPEVREFLLRTTKRTDRALSRCFPFAHFAVTAVTAARALITCLAIVEKDLHDAIDRETGAWSSPSPVAVVTASSRMSLGSVLLFFSADHRDG